MTNSQRSSRRRGRAALFLLVPILIAMVPLAWIGRGRGEDLKLERRGPGLSSDPKDWPLYNADVLGTRHNRGETALKPENVAGLVEKWRFPPEGSSETVGVIHATPTVVNGYVYFGTTTHPTFYKLTPSGKVKWTYRNPDFAPKPAKNGLGGLLARAANSLRDDASRGGILGSALVTVDGVYFGDTEGYLYGLDRFTGKEKWKINTRSKDFPGAHDWNFIMSSPILAEGRVLFAGGPFEHLAGATPFYPCCTGRGFVVALDPQTGRILWKYDVGPKPERLNPPVVIEDSRGKHTFTFGPSTSSVWSTPSFDAETGTVFFGTDTHNSPRQPTDDDPSLSTPHSCAVIAVDVRNGKEKWVSQINPGDVWNYALRGYDPATGLYKDQSVGDTPKIYTLDHNGTPTRVVGVGCKNGAFYVLRASDGQILHHTPVYNGPPTQPLSSPRDPSTLALPSAIGGLQTGCATDGRTIYTNGIDAIRLGTQDSVDASHAPPTGGRVVALSLDTNTERWRHERPRIAHVGGPPPAAVYEDVGDPVASGIAIGNGVLFFTTVVSNKLVALDADTGRSLKEIDLGPVWSGPSISRGRVYVGTGNTLFNPNDKAESYFPKRLEGTLHSFGLPGEDEVDRLGDGVE